MLLNILLVILVLDCIALTGVILMQRSEGGALGMGGGPQGMFTARGAGDLLTRTTSILTGVFFVLSMVITLLAGHERANTSLTQRMKVNPIDITALANGSSAPAASSAPSAPPLPTAPPLPNAAPPLPTTAPAPSLGVPHAALSAPQLRQQLPTTAPAPTGGAPAAPANQAPSGQ
jgi:preprotein translocase subunit SecG